MTRSGVTSDGGGNIFTNLPTTGSTVKILEANVHRAQQTDVIKILLQCKETVFANVLPGSTSRVQSLDVVINKPFKNAAKDQFQRHLEENLDDYVDGKLTVSERRILTTKWIVNAWERKNKNCQNKMSK